MGISREQALDCFRSDDLVGIGMEADSVRARLHPEGVVSYAVERRIDCGSVANGAAEVVLARLCDEVRKAVEMGASGVRLTGVAGGIEEWERLIQSVRERFAEISLEALSAAEACSLAGSCGLGISETISRLRAVGLDSIAGDGTPLEIADWVEVHRAAHHAGMRTEAAMVFGGGETIERRVDFLEAVRGLQEETGGFRAFVPVGAEPANGRELDGVTAVERLKTLAIARMFLDGIENVQASWTRQGLKVRQMELRFGANDIGAAGGASEEDLRRVIRDAGFRPAQRDVAYRAMMLN